MVELEQQRERRNHHEQSRCFDDTIEYTTSPISVEFYVKLNETQDGGVCLGFLYAFLLALTELVIGIRRPSVD